MTSGGSSRRFHQRIQASLADENLQAALDANAERRIAVREKAFASLPDHAALRQRAHAVRAEVIAHLDEYLEQFLERARANGVIVHRAKDAAQAVQAILDISRQHGARLLAKSKTMVSEEIELNRALEAAGLQVVETDLGEYIVQLRGEPPSHIITPAVHLRRADVGKTFHEKLGIPFTEDIPTMTTAARKALREVFLTAEIGISGVNFGVAETGTICVLTNEGNGRMVTTVPRVHIALMGMERLVPTLDDLAVMLDLLPRSATGQKITVYASLLHGPRRADDPDGPQERHLVVVDNGRSAMRQSPLAEMLYCIRCGACLNACPVFREIGGYAYVSQAGRGSAYPGPMGSVLSPALFGQEAFGQLARASSLCGACKEACPVDIDLPKLLLRVRAGQGVGAPVQPNAPDGLALGLRLFSWAAVSPGRFGLAQRLAGAFGGLGRLLIGQKGPQGDDWLRLPAVTGWGYSKDFPRPRGRVLRKWMEERFKHGEHREHGEGERESGREGEGGLLREERSQRQEDERLAGEEGSRREDGEAVEARPVEKLAQELEALGATFERCGEGEAAGRVLGLLRGRGIQTILAWEADLPDGLLGALKAGGVEVRHPTAESKPQDCQVRAGLSGALAALPETGTLLLAGGPGRPLAVSLLPELHIVVVRERVMCSTLAQMLNLPAVRQAAAAALVSGPSRTADIEMTLTIGVHGPGELHVICIDG